MLSWDLRCFFTLFIYFVYNYIQYNFEIIYYGDYMNFIIYEDDFIFTDMYKSIIFKLMCNSNIDYHIIEFNSYDKKMIDCINKLKGSKIFILDIEVKGKSGFEVAKEIRDLKDYLSPIIIVTEHEEYCLVGYLRKILMLDFISKRKDLNTSLEESLQLALNIVDSRPSLKYSYRGESFRIYLEDILYIEKKLNDNNSIIVSKNGEFEIPRSISVLASELPKNMFYKSHRSCLVNISNILFVDYDNSVISFGNIKTNLLSRSNRKGLKERIA